MNPSPEIRADSLSVAAGASPAAPLPGPEEMAALASGEAAGIPPPSIPGAGGLSSCVVPDQVASPPRLLGTALRGLQITGILTGLKTILDLGGQLTLARILAPSAFGVFGFAQSLSGLVSCFTDVAGQRYLIQKRGALDRRSIDSVFTFELMLGILVGGLWIAGSGPLLTALGRPEQVPFARCLALWIVLERLMLPRALLDRKMAFGRSNLALVLGTVAAVIAMVIAALAGAGAYTFIIGLIVRTSVSAVGMWAWAPVRPRLSLSVGQIRPLLLFGLPILATGAITFYYTNVDYVVIQAALGYSALGLYYAAYRYPHYIHQLQYLVSTVVYPAFTKAADRRQLARGFSLVTKYCAAVGFPAIVVIWVMGDGAVRALLSEKWVPATFCFQMFTLLAVMRMVTVHWYDVYVSQGRTRVVPFASSINAVLTTAAAVIGVRWAGIEGAAVLVTAASTVTILFCCTVLLKRMLPVRYVGILKVPFAAAAAAGWIGYAAARHPWIGGAGSGEVTILADFVLRAGFLFAVYGAVFLAADWRELKQLVARARARRTEPVPE